jgi:hypothetical protein
MSQLSILMLPIPLCTILNLLLLFWAIARASKKPGDGMPVIAALWSQTLSLGLLLWVITILVPLTCKA